MAELVTEKLSFVSKIHLLFKATSDESEPTPGYMYLEVSSTYCEELANWLIARLGKRSSHVKLKVLRIMKYIVLNGHPQFKQHLRKTSQGIVDATKHSGPPDALHGNAYYLAVRNEAQELLKSLFTVSDNEEMMSTAVQLTAKGMGSTKSSSMQGFGNTITTTNRSLGDTIINLAERVVESVSSSSNGRRNDVTFVPFNVSGTVGQFPGYRPVTMEGVMVDDNPIDRRKQREKIRKSVRPSVHKPGVAGGGWDDDEEDIDSENQESLEESSDGADTYSDRNADSEKLEDFSSEMILTNGLLLDSQSTFPSRTELKEFVARCSRVNCERVVKLLAAALCNSSVIVTMRSLLAIETILRSDLVTPDHVTVTCHQQLRALYMVDDNDCGVRQKARKIIRTLEKLAPKQAVLFEGIPVSKTAEIQPPITSHSEQTNVTNETHNSVNDFVSTAFPFLLASNNCT